MGSAGAGGAGGASGSAEGTSSTTRRAGGRGTRTKGFTSRPSARLNPHKSSSPWGSGTAKQKTKFAALYSSGGVPCRIEHHGASKHDLKWDRDFEELDYATLLPACADGMRETAHPYTFIARTGFQQLLAYERAGAKAKPVLPQVAVGLRMSFADKDAGVFTACLAALRQLSAAVGPALNPHLKALLGQLARKALDPKLRDDVTLTLQQLEENGGPEAFAVIKSKVPTYTTVCL